jgi:ribokinase
VRPYDVTVVGSLNMDLVVYGDELPARGETRLAERFVMVPGGKGLNQAIAAARQGARTAMVGVLGTDDLGDRLGEVAAADGVDLTHVRRDPAVGSGVALITVDGRGDNTILVVPQANGRLGPGDVAAAASAVTGTGVLLVQLETPLAAVQEALACARAAGVTTVLNPAPAPTTPLPRELLALADLVVPNETEAAALTGEDTSDTAGVDRAAAALLGAGAGAVLLTLGERGALYRDADRTIRVPTSPVTAVDATAAGDAFCGALAAALSHGRPLEDALARAAAAGALAVTVAGAVPSLPMAAAVDALLAARPPTGV